MPREGIKNNALNTQALGSQPNLRDHKSPNDSPCSVPLFLIDNVVYWYSHHFGCLPFY